MNQILLFLCALFCINCPVFGAYDDGARYAFLASTLEKSISIIDLHKRKLAAVVSLKHAPDSIAASQTMKALIVAHRTEKRLTLIDLSTDSLDQHEYSLLLSPDYIKLSPLGDTLAIYDRELRVLEVQSIRRHQTLLRVEDIESSEPLTFNLDGSSVYWVDQGAGALKSSDLWSKSAELVLTKRGGGLSAMSRSVDGLLGFVSDSLAGKVYAIDLKRFKLLKEIYVGRNPGRPWGTNDGSTLLVANGDDGTLSALSAITLDTLYTADALVHPVAVNPGWLDTTAAVIGKKGSVVLLDLATGSIAEKLQLEGSPREGIVTSDSRTLAVPLAGSGRLALIDMRSRTLLSEITGLPSDIGEAALAVSNNLCH
ncbi:MAG: WD40 repeat domain-containing protein [Spongiibacteraceae bacterium]|nr:WD40 repeat domain-containing protein [Spongiibacteraceae bacterium]